MPSEDYPAGGLGNQRRTLGFLWIVYGIFRLIVGIALILWSGTATVMFGALLARVPDPFSMMTEFHIVYMGVIVLSFVCAVLGIFAGLALMANGGSARMLAILAAFFSVCEIPFGTTLGIYTLVVFLRSNRSS
jgi:hypothetical protein